MSNYFRCQTFKSDRPEAPVQDDKQLQELLDIMRKLTPKNRMKVLQFARRKLQEQRIEEIVARCENHENH